MKKVFLKKVLLISAISVAFVSCSDDDDTIDVSGNKIPAGQESVDLFNDFNNDELVFVEGGSFLMGAQAEDVNSPNYDSQACTDESSVHQVSVSSFYIMKNEISQAIWDYVMFDIALDSIEASKFSYPVCNVSYDDIVNKFIPRLNKKTGIAYRLPTEAEWEYAARGGQNNEYNGSLGQIGEYFKFAGSNNADDVACYGLAEANKIASKTPNALNLYDMSGNMWEWCSDWYGAYPSKDVINPQGASSGEKRVVRGGGWNNLNQYCRVSYRSAVEPNHNCDHIGFRLVVSAE